MLQQIEGEDLVARELQYHQECYRDYTRFLSKVSKPLAEIQSGYMTACTQFCEGTIRKRELDLQVLIIQVKVNNCDWGQGHFVCTYKESYSKH